MSKINHNDPAFPEKDEYGDNINGLTIRQELAARFMAALISHYGASNPDSNAKMALDNADALIKKLNETGG